MALNYVTLTLDLYDGQGNAITSGTALLTPTAQLTDTTNHEVTVQAPVPCVFHAAGTPTVKLLATDNAPPAPPGWMWTVSFTGVAGDPPSFSFLLPFTGGSSQNLSSLAPLAAPSTLLGSTAAGVSVYPSGDTTGAADQAAITAAEALGRTVYLAPGTFWVTGLVKQAATIWQGAGRDSTIIKLANGSNADVIQGAGFSALTLSGSSSGGIGGWGIRDCTIDGNGANQSGTSYGVRVWGYDFDLTNVTIRNALNWGLYTEYGGNTVGPGPDLTEESHYYGVKIYGCAQGGWLDRGPHDSRSYDVTISGNGAGFPGYWAQTCASGITTVAAGSNGADLSAFTSGSPGTLNVSTTLGFPSASASATQGSITVPTALSPVVLTYTGTTATTFTGCVAQGSPSSGSTVSTGVFPSPPGPSGRCYGTNGSLHEAMHCYGSGMNWQYILDGQVRMTDCTFEVGATGMCLIRYSGAQVLGGWMFILSGASQTGCGVQLGDTANGVQQVMVHTTLSNLANTSAGTASVVISNDQGGNDVDVMVWATGSPTTVWTGTPLRESRYRIGVGGQSRATCNSLSYWQAAGQQAWELPGSAATAWNLTQAGTDLLNINTSTTPKRVDFPNGTLARWYSDNYSTVQASLNGSTGALTVTSANLGSGKITSLASGSAATDAAAIGQLAGTPSGGSPSGCIAQTVPWWFVAGSAIAAASGTLYLHAVTLPAGIPVSDITFAIGSTTGSTLTHGWYVLLNSALLQVAHTADQTSGSLAASTAVTKALVTPYTPAATAPYYIGYMVVASVQPTFCGSASVQGGSMFIEFPSNGASSTSLTTPGTDGSTSYIAISAAGDPVYGYVS